MSYMTENSAKKFYDGVDPPEDQLKVHSEDDHHLKDLAQKVINYCVVQSRHNY